jgi:hypothetical protein
VGVRLTLRNDGYRRRCNRQGLQSADRGGLLPPLPANILEKPDSYIPWVADVAFRQNSNLMIVKANPDPSKGRTSYAHYFLWENNRWKLLRRIPMEPNER